MKKIFNNNHILAALLMAGAAFTACSSDELAGSAPAPEKKSQTYTLTVEAAKGDAQTRALNIDETTGNITATWTKGDKVTVFAANDASNSIGTLEAQADGKTTTFTGTITASNLKEGDELTLKYLNDAYTKQDGTLKYISDNVDYAIANVKVKTISDTQLGTVEPAQFKNQQAIVQLTLVDAADGTTKLNPTQIDLRAFSGELQVQSLLFNIPETTYTTNGAGLLYLALPVMQNSYKLIVTATVGSDTYTYESATCPFIATKFYTGTMKITLVKKAASISFANNSITKTEGDASFTNTLTNSGDGTVKYTSDNSQVATVNETSGEVTIIGAGTATITATVSDSKRYTYATKSVSYTLTVNAKQQEEAGEQQSGEQQSGEQQGGEQQEAAKPTAATISFAQSSVNKTVESAAFTNTLTNTGDGTVTYSSSNKNVATVNASGLVTIVGAGTATITATVSDTEKYTYANKSVSYTLTVGDSTNGQHNGYQKEDITDF